MARGVAGVHVGAERGQFGEQRGEPESLPDTARRGPA